VRDLDDPVRGVDDVQAERLRAALLDRAARAVHVERDLAAEEVVRVETAEDDVGVGHGRLDAAAAIADGPRIGARALRPYPQQPAGVDPGDRAAAGADLDEVDDRRADGVAREREAADARRRVAADLVVLRDRRPAP